MRTDPLQLVQLREVRDTLILRDSVSEKEQRGGDTIYITRERVQYRDRMQDGVGQLIKMAIEKGRSVRPGMRTGICGEHGGEPTSVKSCAKVGMNYACCSPFHVPIAR